MRKQWKAGGLFLGGAPYAALINLTGQPPSGLNGIGSVSAAGIDIFLV
jgi:hypothetical protein